MEPFYRRLNDEVESEMCALYYNWTAYHQLEMNLDERTEGMNCSEVYDYLARDTTTTWQPTRDPDPDMFCQNNVTSTIILNKLDVDPDLFDRWIVQLIVVSVTLRVLAVFILWVINKEGFSWIRNRLAHCICCLCPWNSKDTKTMVLIQQSV